MRIRLKSLDIVALHTDKPEVRHGFEHAKNYKEALTIAKRRWPNIKGIRISKITREYQPGKTAQYYLAKAPEKNIKGTWDPW